MTHTNAPGARARGRCRCRDTRRVAAPVRSGVFTIIPAHTPEWVPVARLLFAEYAASLPFSLGYQNFEAELADLPGKYAPPAGAILLAVETRPGPTVEVSGHAEPTGVSAVGRPASAMDGLDERQAGPARIEIVGFAGRVVRAVGCIAMRPIAGMPGDPAPVCEMKRMYVCPGARGRGLGWLLAETLLDAARAAGYRMMKLDTERSFEAAVGLYRSLGFVEIARYNDDPMPDTMWMGLRL